MAARVNTKFVITLSSIIVFLAAGLIFVLWQFVYNSPEKLEREGDTALEQGDYVLARKRYGSAFGKDQDNVLVLEKYADVVEQMPVTDLVEARQNQERLFQALRKISELAPEDNDRLKRYFDLLAEVGAWGPLESRASAQLNADPDNLVVRQYRAKAGVQLLNVESTRAEREQVLEDIQMVLDAQPDNAEAANYLAQWKLAEADRLRRLTGRQGEVDQLREEAIEISSAMLGKDPDNPQRKLEHALVLDRVATLYDPFTEEGEKAIEALRVQSRPYVDELEAQLLENPSPPETVLLTVELLQRVYYEPIEQSPDEHGEGHDYTSEGMQRAIALLEAAEAADPQYAGFPLRRGNTLMRQNRLTAALEAFEKARAAGTSTTNAMEAVLAHRIRVSATHDVVNLKLQEMVETDDEQRTEELVAEIKPLIEEIRLSLGDSGAVNLLEGKLAAIQRDLDTAKVKLDKACEQFQFRNIDALNQSGVVHMLSGNWGVAIDRFKQMLAIQPNNLNVRLMLAQVYIQSRQTMLAEEQLDRVLITLDETEKERLAEGRDLSEQHNEWRRRALQLKAEALGGESREEALAILEGMEADSPLVAMKKAQLYYTNDQVDEAQRILHEQFDTDPTNIRILAMLLQMTFDPQQQQELLEQARQAGADENMVSSFEQQLAVTTPEERLAFYEKQIEQQPDPFMKALLKVALYREHRDTEKVNAALAEAEQLGPDRREFIQTAFTLALENEQWDRASELADRAGRLNLDLANGDIYRGRIALQRGNNVEAISILRRGLSAYPVNSEGRRLLGDALRLDQQYDMAVTEYQAAIEQKPDNTMALRGLATVANLQGNHELALQTLKEVVKYLPNNFDLYDRYLAYEAEFGNIKLALEKRQELDDRLVKARQRIARVRGDEAAAPSELERRNRREVALMLAMNDQHAEARRQIDQVIEDEGRTRDNINILAGVVAESGDPMEGARIIDQYINDLGPDIVVADDYLMMAHFLRRYGDTPSVIAAYARAMRLEDQEDHPVAQELAALLFNTGNYPQALTLYEDLYQRLPDNPLIALRLAETQLNVGDYDAAEKTISEIEAAHPSRNEINVLRAKLAEVRGNNAEAVQLITRAIDRDKGRGSLYYERGRLLLKDPENERQALDDLDKALELDPNAYGARMLLAENHMRHGDVPETIRELHQLVTRNPTYVPGRQKLIELYLNSADYDAARTLLTEAITIQPEQAQWHRQLADLEFATKNYRESMLHWRDTLHLQPNEDNIKGFTLTMLSLGQNEAVIATLREQASLVNDSPELQAIRGRALAASGRSEEARQVFLRALERCESGQQLLMVAEHIRAALGPEASAELMVAGKETANDVWIELALAHKENSERAPEAALSRLENIAPQISDSDPTAKEWHRRLMASTLYATDQYERSREVYEQLVADSPNDVATLNNLAYLLAEKLGDMDAALPLAERAVQLRPGDPNMLDTLGRIQFLAGQAGDARLTLERSVAIQSLPENHLHLAEVYDALGLPGSALEHAGIAERLAEEANRQDILEQARALLQRLGQ